jgi:hypothetical protein
MSYSSSLKSLSNTKLDAMLTQYGASTVGSTERKRERLQRFIDAQTDRDLADSRRRIARDAETGEPALKRRRIEPEPVRRSARLAAQQCPSPSSAPAFSPVRRPATSPLPGTQHRMVTRSMARAAAESPRPRRNSPAPSPARRSHAMVTRSQDANQRSAARMALQRIHDILAAYLA